MSRWRKWRALSRADRLLLLRASMMLVRARATLSSTGFRPDPDECASAAWSTERLDRARQVAHLVGMAAAVTPVRVACLHRSVVLWSLLRQEGMPCRLRLGAGDLREGPFEAHAWVECGGVALDEQETHLVRFRPFGVAVVPVGRSPARAEQPRQLS